MCEECLEVKLNKIYLTWFSRFSSRISILRNQSAPDRFFVLFIMQNLGDFQETYLLSPLEINFKSNYIKFSVKLLYSQKLLLILTNNNNIIFFFIIIININNIVNIIII